MKCYINVVSLRCTLTWYRKFKVTCVTCIHKLKLSTLEQYRDQTSLIMLHKTINKQVNVDHSHLITTRNNTFLIPHLKHTHTHILSADYTT